MVLADDDFGVYTEFARAAQDFDDAARGSGAAPRIANQLDVDDGAIEFRKTRNAPPAEAAFIDPAESEFLGEAWRQFMPCRNFHFVLHTSVVRQHDIVARAIAKQTNEGGMRAVQDSHDAALRSEEHTSELQSQSNLVCRLLLEKKKQTGAPQCESNRQ